MDAVSADNSGFCAAAVMSAATAAEDMAIYDALPEIVRRALREANEQWDSRSALDVVRHTPSHAYAAAYIGAADRRRSLELRRLRYGADAPLPANSQ